MIGMYLVERFSRMAQLENQLEVQVFQEGLFLESCYRIVERFWSFLPCRCCHCGLVHKPWDFLSFVSIFKKCPNLSPLFCVISELFFFAILYAYASRMGLSPALVFFGSVFVIFFIISIIDFRFYIIPDELNLLGAVIGLISAIYISISGYHDYLAPLPSVGFFDSIQGLVVGAGVLYSLGALASQILNRDAMGGGDIKLCAFLGACFGLKPTLMCLALASVLGSIFGITAMLKSKFIDGNQGYTMIAFGPYIIISALIVLYVGPDNLLHSYQEYSLNIFQGYVGL